MKYAITFLLGAAAGSLVTWKIVEKKYKDLADEEIASVTERYKSRYKEIETEVTQVVKENNDKEVEAYRNILKDMNYKPDNDYTNYGVSSDIASLPSIISPEEFGELTGYDSKSWTCYADNIVTDEDDEIVNNPEDIIGDALDHIGEYADDAVYVRNFDIKCDYEILKHEKTYDEIFKDTY